MVKFLLDTDHISVPRDSFRFDDSKEIRMRLTLLVLATLLVTTQSIAVSADGPPKILPGAKQAETLPRLPDDQIEGTIWEYKGTLKEKPKEGEEAPTLEGRFRTEGKAIFDLRTRVALPEKKEVEKTVESVKAGKPKEIKLPAPAQQKRIGQYRKIDGGKLRLDLDDKESLNGIMIIWPKKDTADVWLGTFAQKEGKTTRNWIIEIRPIED